jgi:hypothetical protein
MTYSHNAKNVEKNKCNNVKRTRPIKKAPKEKHTVIFIECYHLSKRGR